MLFDVVEHFYYFSFCFLKKKSVFMKTSFVCTLSRDEAEEISFVPTAISIPHRPMFWCDNRCRDKAPRFWQFASVVVEDGKEAHTVNLCQQCYDESLTAKGLAPLKNWQRYAIVEKKAHGTRPVHKECGSTSRLKE